MLTTPGSWGQLKTRLEAIGEKQCKDKGFGLVTVHIMIDATGQPAFWSEPQVVMIEPRIGARAFMEKVMNLIAKSTG